MLLACDADNRQLATFYEYLRGKHQGEKVATEEKMLERI